VRAAGVSGVLVYCSNYRCSHWIKLSASRRCADEVRLSDIEPRFTCEACGRPGAANGRTPGIGTAAIPSAWLVIMHYVYLTIAFVGVVTLVFVSLVALATVIG
jgi:hypothetical protein